MTATLRKTGSATRYDAFVSYSHDSDRERAPGLKAEAERLAKPWYRPRALRLFLDTASLSADPALWASIERALSASSWFVLLASPAAARSPWVDRELRWWLEHRTADRLLLVLTEGTLEWDSAQGDFDAERSTSIPPALQGAFVHEPLWIDGRDGDPAVGVAAALRGMAPDDLVGLAVREHRRTMRLARSAIAALATLLIATVAGAIVALDQRDSAREQARIATARQLAGVSAAQLQTNLDVALLLAVAAHRTDPGPQTRAALLGANAASPALVRYLQAGAPVTDVAGSGDGTVVAAGLGDGRVQRWSLADARRSTVLELPRAVTSVATSRDGNVVAAADGSRAVVWRAGRPPAQIDVPAGQKPDVVAVTPSGRAAVVRAAPSVFGAASSVVVHDVAAAQTRAAHPDAFDGLPSSDVLVAPSDEELLLFDTGYGAWQRRRIADWSLLAESSAAFGTHEWGGVPSADGRLFTGTNGNPTIPIWRTTGRTDHDRPARTAEAPISDPSSLALSPDGTRLAVADSGVIYSAPVAPPGAPRAPAVELTGQGSVNARTVRFLGDSDHLVSATRDAVALWDLGRLDRLARTQQVPVGAGCGACGGPTISVSPDGRRAAIIDGFGGGAIVPLTGGGTARRLSDSLGNAASVWTAGGRHVALPVGKEDEVQTAAVAGDGKTAIVVTTRGRIDLRDAVSGDLRGTVAEPEALALGSDRLEDAAVHASPDLVARLYKGGVTIVDARRGTVVGRIAGPGIRYVAYAGPRLLAQRRSGVLEVWDARGSRRERVLAGDESYVWPPVGSPRGTLAARLRANGTLVLAELDTGAVLATLRTPGAGAAKTGVAFSPGGERLITVTEPTGDEDASLLVQRDISDAALVRTACATVGRDLRADEWRAFVGSEPPTDLACR